MKRYWRRFRKNPLFPAIAITIGVQAMDVFTSITPSQGVEQNPFTRFADGSYWLWHGIVNKLLYFGVVGLESWMIYATSRHYNKKLAYVLAMLPMFYYCYGALDAVFSNIQLIWGWYVILPSAIPHDLR